MFDQYMNKIWSYRYKSRKSVKGIISIENESSLTLFLTEARSRLLELKERNGSTCGMEYSKLTNPTELVDFIEKMKLPEMASSGARDVDVARIYLTNERNSHEDVDINIKEGKSSVLNLIKTMLIEHLNFFSNGVSFRAFSGHGSLEGLTNKMIDFNLIQLDKAIKLSQKPKSKTKLVSKKPTKLTGLNIGIEIEFEGCNCQHLEKDLLKLGAVSFHSGWDGCEKDGDEEGSRLRENRLRLESYKSLPALFYLLEQMIALGCTITNKSGMHYHVDCRDSKKWNKVHNIRGVSLFKNVDMLHYKQMHKVFEKMQADGDWFYEQISIKSDFKTVEWRMGSQTLNYSKITLQILVAIHITEAFTNNSKPNLPYLTMLAEVYSEI